MPHDLDLIYTLTGGLTAALVLGFFTQRLKLSPIVGYLLAGVAVGPFTPGFVAHRALADQLAELGVILLLFGVGLHFHPKELLAVRKIAVPGAVAQIAVATGLGTLVAHLFGFGLVAGLVFGLAISVASTVVLLRVLSDHDALHTPSGHVAVGWLLVEDLFTVIVLVLLPIVAGDHAGGGGSLVVSIGLAVIKIGALVAFTLYAGRRVIPKILAYVAETRSRELFTLTVLVIALGIAVCAAKLFGASMALGAFLAGMVVGQSPFSSRAASEALPMRDAFAVLFFVSVGMLFDPSALAGNAGLVAATLAVVLLGKPLTAIVVVLLLRRPAKTAASVGIALAQIGEFSFILATLGKQLGLVPEREMQAIVAAAIVSITLSPLLYRLVDPLARLLPSPSHAHAPHGAAEPEAPGEAASHAIVVGHGPVGSAVTRLLREASIEPTIIELNHERVEELTAAGVRAVYGDAAQHEILEHAGVKEAESLIFTSNTPGAEAVIRAAKDLNPKLLILARATYISEVAALKKAGASVVVAAEAEVAFAMSEHLLTALGATGEQIERARDKTRAEIWAEPGS